MTQPTDRELLTEIHRAWVMASDTGGVIHHLSGPMSRVAAALAQPGPERLTDEQWDAIKDRLWDKYETVGHHGERFMYQGDFDTALDVARKDLTRWGRPTIEPVPVAERLPGPEDCFSDQHGQRSYKCWAQQYHTDNDGQPLRTVLEAWDLVDYRLLARCRRWYYAWLPHHALPIPTTH
jgi:hypothetical protein